MGFRQGRSHEENHHGEIAQNPLLSKILIETGTKRLVEATTDLYWGASATITSKSIQDDKWKGANRYGILLSEHREELRRIHSIDQMKKSPAASGDPSSHNNQRNMSITTSPSGSKSDTSSQQSSGNYQLSTTKPVGQRSLFDSQSDPTPKKTNKRDATALSPLGSSSVIRRKASSPTHTTAFSVSRQRSLSKSPASASIVPPMGDIFACDTDTDIDPGQEQKDDQDFTVFIGTQSI